MKIPLILAAVLSASFFSAANATEYHFRQASPGLALNTQNTPPALTPPPGAVFARMTAVEAGIALSNDSLTVIHTASGTWSRSQASIGKSSGKWYWEVTLNRKASGALLGPIPQGYSAGGYFGSGTYHTGGLIYTKGTPIPMLNEGETVGVMLDMDTKVVSYMVKCGAPVAGETLLAVATNIPFTIGQNGSVFSVNFGASPFLCQVPTGFNMGLWQ